MVARDISGTNLVSRIVDKTSEMYYLYNGHADVTELITPQGEIAAEYTYDAFGVPKTTTGTADNPFRYAGYQYDESGLYYLKSRMYNPVIARFMQEDTNRGEINDPLSLNLYAYCSNNPIKYIDPYGHKDVAVRTSNETQGNKVEFNGKVGSSTIKIITPNGAEKTLTEGKEYYIKDGKAY